MVPPFMETPICKWPMAEGPWHSAASPSPPRVWRDLLPGQYHYGPQAKTLLNLDIYNICLCSLTINSQTIGLFLVGCTILEASEFGDLPNYQAGFTKSGTCQGFEDDEALWCWPEGSLFFAGWLQYSLQSLRSFSTAHAPSGQICSCALLVTT